MVVEAMPWLMHYLLLPILLLLLLLAAAAGSGVHCTGEKKVVPLEELQWRKSSTSQPWLPQRRSMSRQNQEGSDAKIPLTSGAKLQTLNYIVTVDTGSDLTWVQCKPCTSCYNQQDPLFDPSASPSYQQILCNSPTCHSLQLATGVSSTCGFNQPNCNYGI